MTAKKSDNKAIWDQVKKTDPAFTKGFKIGAFEGTAVDFNYNAMRATELFGPYGIGWRVVITKDEMVTMGNPEAPETIHTLHIEVHYKYKGEEGIAIGIGHTPVSYKKSDGSRWVTDREYGKKSMTDAMAKALSLMGFSVDIHLGFYDNKYYVQAREQEAARKKAGNGKKNNDGGDPKDDAPKSNNPKGGSSGEKPESNAKSATSNEDPPPPPPNQKQSHDQARQMGSITVHLSDGNNEESPRECKDGHEAGKLLADRITATDSWFNANKLLGSNLDWVAQLPDGWRERLESLVKQKRPAGDINGVSSGKTSNESMSKIEILASTQLLAEVDAIEDEYNQLKSKMKPAQRKVIEGSIRAARERLESTQRQPIDRGAEKSKEVAEAYAKRIDSNEDIPRLVGQIDGDQFLTADDRQNLYTKIEALGAQEHANA